MKRIRLILIAVILVTTCTYSSVTFAQEGSRADKEREKEIQRAIIEQKKALEEQNQVQQDVMKSMKELEQLKEFEMDFDLDIDDDGNQVRVFRRGNRSFSMPGNYNLHIPDAPDAPGAPRVHVFAYGGDTERTSWDFTKSLKENSFKKEYSFDVEKTVKSVVMSVSGDCRDGEIRIKILTPQGKTYSDVVIDEFGNLNVRKSFTISETENQDKTGEWKFQINSDNATGSFKISFQTY
jgi:hypothetical protein